MPRAGRSPLSAPTSDGWRIWREVGSAERLQRLPRRARVLRARSRALPGCARRRSPAGRARAGSDGGRVALSVVPRGRSELALSGSRPSRCRDGRSIVQSLPRARARSPRSSSRRYAADDCRTAWMLWTAEPPRRAARQRRSCWSARAPASIAPIGRALRQSRAIFWTRDAATSMRWRCTKRLAGLARSSRRKSASDATLVRHDDARAIGRAIVQAARRHDHDARGSRAATSSASGTCALNRLLQLREMPPAVAERLFAELSTERIRTATCRLATEASLACDARRRDAGVSSARCTIRRA